MKVILNGEFSEDDLIKFAELLRDIEQKNPSLLYTMLFQREDLSVEDATKLVKRIYSRTYDEITKRSGGE